MSERPYTGIGARRAHKKPRLGCAGCKRRRIKCDESKPQCANCTKHAKLCDYPQVAQSPTSVKTSPIPLNVPEECLSVEWGVVTAKLMHHWTVSTSYSLSDDPALHSFMQIDAARIAFANEHVLHMILALSALHLVRLDPTQKQVYTNHAERHYQASLRIVIPLLPKLNEENCHHIFLFASLCNGHSLAKGPKPGDFLLFSDNGPAEWSVLFRGMLPLLKSYGTALINGPLAPLIRPGAEAASHALTSLPSPEKEQLSHLRHLVRSISGSTDGSYTIEAAMDHLCTLYSSRYSSTSHNRKTNFQHIGIWLWRCTDGLMELAQDRNPAALVIFAYACVALNDISGVWAMTGWVPHLLAGIHKNLPPQYHSWIEWPLQQVGWTPT